MITISMTSHWAPVTQGHHVVYEEIGELAGALSYVHVVMPMNLTAIQHQINRYLQEIASVRTEADISYHNVTTHMKKNSVTPKTMAQLYGTNYHTTSDQLKNTYYGQVNITQFHEELAQRHQNKLDNIHDLFPVIDGNHGAFSSRKIHVIKRSTRATNQDLLSSPREKRSLELILSAINGVAGTFMGLYNRRKLDKLQEELTHTIKEQNRIIGVQAQHSTFLTRLDTAITNIQVSLWYASIASHGVTDRALAQFDTAISDSLTIAINAIQAAQNHRLAIDFLTPDQLNRLYSKLIITAQEHSDNLVSENPSDLFQMELSYIYDKDDITLILHVPMVPKDMLLR